MLALSVIKWGEKLVVVPDNVMERLVFAMSIITCSNGGFANK